MSQSQNTNDTIWWEKELSVIRPKLDTFLSGRLPAFRGDHDDLVHETLFALTKHLRKYGSSLPESWFDSNNTVSSAEKSRFHKLAMVILKRRIADFFRKRAPLSNLSSINTDALQVADANAPSPERNILLAKMFQVTLSVLDEMKPKDRDLVMLISEDVQFRKSLGPRERQRLHRIRRRLKDEITRRLGAEASELLGNDP